MPTGNPNREEYADEIAVVFDVDLCGISVANCVSSIAQLPTLDVFIFLSCSPKRAFSMNALTLRIPEPFFFSFFLMKSYGLGAIW